MACLLPLPKDLQDKVAHLAHTQLRIDSATSELCRQLRGWCDVYWEYVHMVMTQDEEYMVTKRSLPEPDDADDHDAWEDYLNSQVGLDEEEFLHTDTFESRHTIQPHDWMLGLRPMCWARGTPEWASRLYDGNLLF